MGFEEGFEPRALDLDLARGNWGGVGGREGWIVCGIRFRWVEEMESCGDGVGAENSVSLIGGAGTTGFEVDR